MEEKETIEALRERLAAARDEAAMAQELARAVLRAEAAEAALREGMGLSLEEYQALIATRNGAELEPLRQVAEAIQALPKWYPVSWEVRDALAAWDAARGKGQRGGE